MDQHEIHHGRKKGASYMGDLRGEFLSEYFPDSVRYDKEVEFLQLTQEARQW